jgi:PAS domain S-box-containing protein
MHDSGNVVRLDRIVDTTPVLLVQCSRDLKYVFVNRAYEQLLGRPLREIAGRPIADVIGVAAFEAIRPHIEDVLRGEVVEYETEVPYATAGTRVMHVRYVPDRDESGEVRGWFATITDVSERTRAERLLREQEATFRTVANAAPVFMWMAGTDKLCTWFNAPWLEFVGRSMEQELGNGWTDNVHPEDFERCVETYTTAFDARRPFSMEYRLRRHDGAYRWVLDHGVPRHGPDGEFMGYIGSCTDITEREEAERARRRTEERVISDAAALANLNELSTRLLRLHSLREGLQEMVHATVKLLGADMGNIQIADAGKGVLTIAAQHGFKQDFLDFFREVTTEDDSACGRALRSGQRIVIEDIDADQAYAPLRPIAHAAGYRAVQSTPLIGRDGAPLGMLSTHWRSPHRPAEQELRRLDLYVGQAEAFIERCRIEDALREREEALRTRSEELQRTLELIPSAVWIAKDPECHEIVGNAAAAALLGVSAASNVSQTPAGGEPPTPPLRHYRDGRLLAPHELPLQRAAATGEPQLDEELDLELPDGGRRTIHGGATPLRDAAGNVRGAVACFRDVTERKKAEQALADADRHKDEFLAMLSHELRNPLGAITNAAHVLKQLGPPQGNLTWARDVIDRQAAHLGRIVDDLLDVSRVSRGLIVLRREPIPVASAVALALETARPLMELRGQSFTSNVPPESIWVDGDLTRLAQVIGNLLSNASRYTVQGGKISLTVQRDGPDVAVRVLDTGIGISADMLPRVFDLFVQGQRTLDRTVGGLGLGLTLARSITEMHGGTIDASSAGPGKGSEFVVRLPLLTGAPLADAAARPILMYEAVRRRILVVDDNTDSAEALAIALGATGHDVRIARDGPSALQAAEEFEPEVVLLDIGLPGMDGYEVGRRLRAARGPRGIVLIALTGYGRDEDRRRTLEAGFDHHLVKPIAPDQVLAVLSPVQELPAASPRPQQPDS